MPEPEIDPDIIRKQLETKRNLLLEEFLENPTNVRLTTEIRSIDHRIAELTCRSEEKKKFGAQ
jgi:hypothetical protein